MIPFYLISTPFDDLASFLLAQLHMDSLVETTSTAEVHEILNNLPKNLDDSYDAAMERIGRQAEHRKQLAKRVLRWIIYAFRPLLVREIQHALTLESGATDLNQDAISACAGLVVIDEERQIIRLVRK